MGFWRIRYADREIGPYPLAVLRHLRERGSLPPDALVQLEGSGAWVPLAAAHENAAPPALPVVAAPPAAPPLPPPVPAPPPLPLRAAAAGERLGRFWLVVLAGLLLPGLALLGIFFAIAAHAEQEIDPRWTMLTMVGVALLAAVHWLAATVWVWRRSRRLRSEPSRVLARALNVAMGLAVFTVVGANGGLVFRAALFVLQRDAYSQFSITAEDGGRTLFYSGTIGYKAASRLRQALAQHPAADTLVLSSRGGWVGAGRGMALVLRGSGIRTALVRGECASACTIPFEAAPRRVLGEGARLGFHSSHNELLGDGDHRSNQDFKQVLDRRAVPAATIARIFATPPDKIWEPDAATLFGSNLIDAIRVDGQDLDRGAYFLAMADRLLEQDEVRPVIAGLHDFAPAALQHLRQELAGILARGGGRAEIGNAFASLGPLEIEAMNRAGDAVQAAYARWVLKVLKRVQPAQPELCRDVWLGGNPAGLLKALTPEERQQFLLLEAAAMESAARQIAPPQPPGTDLVRRAFQPVATAYGAGAVNAADAARLPDRELCAIAVTFYDGVQRLPPGQAGSVLRWLGSGQDAAARSGGEDRPGGG